jgi:hypothetical protein
MGREPEVYPVDKDGNEADYVTVTETEMAIGLYNIGFRGEALEEFLATVYGENGYGWTSGEIALNIRRDNTDPDPDGRFPTPEDSWGPFQLNLFDDPDNWINEVWERSGYESMSDAIQTLDGNLKALAIFMSNNPGGRLRKRGGAVQTDLSTIFGAWGAYDADSLDEASGKVGENNWGDRLKRAKKVLGNAKLPDGWDTEDPRWKTFRNEMWTQDDIVGPYNASIGRVQLAAGLDVDNVTPKKEHDTYKVGELNKETNRWQLKADRVDARLGELEATPSPIDWANIGEIDTGRLESYQTDQARNLPRPISARGEYDLDQDAYVNPADDPALVGTIASFQDADAAGLEEEIEVMPKGKSNPPGFDPWPFVDAPPNMPGQPGTGGVEGDFGPQAGSLGFLRGRADARIFDPKTGQEYDFVEFMEHQLRGETDPDRIALWIDTWLPKTAWFQNTPATVRGRISEWFSEGMGAEEGDWTGARRGRVQPYYDTLLDLIQREGFEAEQSVIWDVAKLGYLYDWDEDKFIRYFSGETVDGETNVQGDVFFEGPTSAAGNIANIKSTMRTSANTYVISMSASEERALAKRIFTGEVPIANVDNIFREKARLLYPYLADFYDAGGTTTEFLDQFDPVMQRMLGRSGEWTGRDYSVGQAALTGDLTDLHYYMYRGGNTMDEVMMGDPETPGSYVPRDPFGRPNQVTAKQDRPLSVQEFKLALKRTEEYQQGGYALAEMGQLLNLLGSGMGAAP